jgi:hypothetical protein
LGVAAFTAAPVRRAPKVGQPARHQPHDTDAPNENGTAGGSLLDEIVRDGARAMLAAALQAEVAAYIDAHLGEVDEA